MGQGQLNTINDSFVGMNGRGEVVIMGLGAGVAIDKAKALRLAAHIVAIADPDDQFAALLAAVRST